MDAGDLIQYLQGFDPRTPIVIDVNTDEGVYLRVESGHLEISADEGAGPHDLELAISWVPSDGWLGDLFQAANETRAELGMKPLFISLPPG